METRRAALYLRQSLDRAEGIDAQAKRCTALAESRGWTIIDTFRDNETRASKPRGPETGWGRMLPRIGKDFDVIVSVDLDRLLRSTKDLNTLIDLGAQVVTVDGEIDLTSADGEFRATMLAGIGRFETRRASERQRRHKAARAARGEWHGGTPPYGFQRDPDSAGLIPNPVEVERIHEVARRMLEDRESMHSIVTDWNNRGITTRLGKHWRQSNLRTIMMNRAMLGERSPGVAAQWPAIIDVRTFDRMNALLTDPARKVTHSPGVKGGKYTMGGGLTVCGACGKPLITHSKQSPNGKVPTLACLARVHGPSDKHPRVERVRSGKVVSEDTGRVSIAHDALEEYVFGELIAKLRASPRFLQRMSETDPAVDDRLDAIEQERRDLRARRERAEEMRLDGDLSRERFRETAEKIDAQLDTLGAEYDSLLRLPVSLADFDPETGIDWRSWTSGRRRAALRGFIRRVEVSPYPAGTARTRPRIRNESEDDYLAAKREILMVATASRTRILWKWES